MVRPRDRGGAVDGKMFKEAIVEALVPSACLFSSVLENKHRYNVFE